MDGPVQERTFPLYFSHVFAVAAKRMTNLESDESLEPNGLHIIGLHNFVIERENTLKQVYIKR